MPSLELPTILPLLFTGVLVGSLLRKTNVGISRKTLLLGSLLGGLGNLIHAAALGMLLGQETSPSIPTTFPAQVTRPTIGAASTSSTFNLVTFLTTSFVLGLLMVLVVLVTAALTMRLRGRVTSDEEK